jgi:SAM-dependent methyltransferase
MLKKLESIFREYFPKRMKDRHEYMAYLKGLKGLEVGGPSRVLSSKGFLPIYNVIKSLDGCNFSTNTVWEGNISAGQTFKYDKNKVGRQYIAEASDLSVIGSETYDFVLSCHSLEHIANPIKAIMEWKRVTRDGGYILFVLPHKDRTFDRKRPLTTLEHMIEDYQRGTGEDDNTHFEDAIKLHDVSMDPGLEDPALLAERTAHNFENRCVHHHIFNTPLLLKLVDYTGLKILKASLFTPFNIVVLARKLNDGNINNNAFLDRENPLFNNSRFPSDKL